MNYNYDISLDLNTKNIGVVVNAKQNDTTRSITATLLQNGIPYSPPTGSTASYRIQKSDGTAVWNQATIKSDNTIYFILTKQCLAAQGRAIADIVLTLNDEVLSTTSFVIDIQAQPNISGLGSSSEATYLEELIENSQYVIQNAQAWAIGKRGTKDVTNDWYEFNCTGVTASFESFETFKSNITPKAYGETQVYNFTYDGSYWNYRGSYIYDIKSQYGILVSGTPVKDNVIQISATFKEDQWHNNAKYYAESVANKESIFRYSIMPAASSNYEGIIAEYIGTTTEDYTRGYFYECIQDGSSYIWQQIQVSQGGDEAIWGNIDGDLEDQSDLWAALEGKQKKIVQSTTAPADPLTGDYWDDLVTSATIGVNWGDISGVLSQQTDLNDALLLKQKKITQSTTAPSNPSIGDYWDGPNDDYIMVQEIDSALSTTSTNPVTNKVITEGINSKITNPDGGSTGNILKKTSTGVEWAENSSDSLFIASINATERDIVRGYYYNSSFYEDEEHTAEITPDKKKLYRDYNTRKYYIYNSSYHRVYSQLDYYNYSGTSYNDVLAAYTAGKLIFIKGNIAGGYIKLYGEMTLYMNETFFFNGNFSFGYENPYNVNLALSYDEDEEEDIWSLNFDNAGTMISYMCPDPRTHEYVIAQSYTDNSELNLQEGYFYYSDGNSWEQIDVQPPYINIYSDSTISEISDKYDAGKLVIYIDDDSNIYQLVYCDSDEAYFSRIDNNTTTNLPQLTEIVVKSSGHTTTTTNLESSSNKVTSWSTTTTDTNYPTEKLVKDSLNTKIDIPSSSITSGYVYKSNGQGGGSWQAESGGDQNLYIIKASINSNNSITLDDIESSELETELEDALYDGKAILLRLRLLSDGRIFYLPMMESIDPYANGAQILPIQFAGIIPYYDPEDNYEIKYYFLRVGYNSDGLAIQTPTRTIEFSSNKVTSWSTTTTNTNYPSEKLVKDTITSLQSQITALEARVAALEG